MLAWELVVEAEALRKQGCTISAIARHLGVTRVTVRQYLSGERTPGVRASSAPDPFAEYVEYCRLRLAADPHLWATTCSTKSPRWAMRGPIRRSLGRSVSARCAR